MYFIRSQQVPAIERSHRTTFFDHVRKRLVLGLIL